jgi:hypothetical protein
MMRSLMISTAAVSVLTFATTAFAQQGGTAQEARAMLDKAVAAVKADRDVALAMFNKGEGGFRDRDLYPFCTRVSDGKGVAGPVYVPSGTDTKALKDPDGKEYGKELYAVGQKRDGEIAEISYMAPKPGTTAPAFAKVSFATKVGDLICGVGYYK